MALIVNQQESPIDRMVVDSLKKSGTNFVCSVPCSLLAGILNELSKKRDTRNVPVAREEEGVGICAGAYLGGARPCLLMQNSGLGNSVNALLSLTSYYKLGLFILIGYRGVLGEERIEAQVPMGEATEALLALSKSEALVIDHPRKIAEIATLSRSAYTQSKVTAALLPPKLWK
jgi:sulfopyruvate decarboxylase subunit alpha